MGNRTKGREIAFQILFQLDMGVQDLDFILANFPDYLKVREQAKEFAEMLARGTAEKREEIDQHISNRAHNWNLKRLTSVDRSILRLGAYELLYREEIPAEVSINEGVELAKKFGCDESPAFVNGVLDQIWKTSSKAKIERKKKTVR
jgi:transcription antitermination protein NusB